MTPARSGLAVLLLAATASAPALAADDFATWYAGGAVVFGNVKFDDGTIDDDAVGGKVLVGYRFNRWLGVEGSYLRSGDYEDDQTPSEPGGDAEYGLRGMTLSAVGYAPIASDDVTFFGKAGMYTFDQDFTLTDTEGEPATSLARRIKGLTLGAGLRVKVAERVDIRAEGEWYDLDGADLWMLSLGVDYRFGAGR